MLLAGLDNLPRSVRAQVDAERARSAAAQKQVAGGPGRGQSATSSKEADLFRSIRASQQWPAQFSQAAGAACRPPRREHGRAHAPGKAEPPAGPPARGIAARRGARLRAAAVAQAAGIQKDAAHWVELKQHLPAQLQEMERDYQAIHSFDLAPVTAACKRPGPTGPRRSPIWTRASRRCAEPSPQADSVWQSSAEARRQAAAGDCAHLDFGALFGGAKLA